MHVVHEQESCCAMLRSELRHTEAIALHDEPRVVKICRVRSVNYLHLSDEKGQQQFVPNMCDRKMGGVFFHNTSRIVVDERALAVRLLSTRPTMELKEKPVEKIPLFLNCRRDPNSKFTVCESAYYIGTYQVKYYLSSRQRFYD